MNDMRDIINKVALSEKEEHLYELKPLGKMGKKVTGAMAKMGNKKAKIDQASSEMADKIYKKWKEDSLKGNFEPSIQLLTRWLEKRGIDADVIEAAFKGVGVDDVAQYMKNSSEEAGAEQPEKGDEFTMPDGSHLVRGDDEWSAENAEGGSVDVPDDKQDAVTDAWQDADDTSAEEPEKVGQEATLPPETGVIFTHTDGTRYKWEGQQWAKEGKDGNWIGGQIKNNTANEAYLSAAKDGRVEGGEAAETKEPQKGDTFEKGGNTFTHTGEKWEATGSDGNQINVNDENQDLATKAWGDEQTLTNAGNSGTEEAPTGDTLSDKAEAAGLGDATEVPQKAVADHIQQEKGATEEQTAEIMQAVGADATSEQPIGDALDPVTKAVNDAEEAGKLGDAESEEEGADVMATVADEMGDRYYREATEAALQAMKDGNIKELSNMEKWGFAVLAAEKGRIKI